MTALADRVVTRAAPAARRRKGPARTGYWFLTPFLLFFGLFFVLPIGVAVYQSLFTPTRTGLLGRSGTAFAGLANYGRVLTDGEFYAGLGRVLLYAVVTIPLITAVAVVLALMLDSVVVRFRKFFRLLVFLPYAVPAVIATLLWSFFYQPQFSPIVRTFDALGVGTPDFLGAHTVLFSMTNIAVWEWAGYNMIIVLSALQAIPASVYEAARLDGCGEVAIALRIKLPMVLPALGLSFLFSLIGAFQFFNEPTVLKPVSAAISGTYTPNIYAYTKAFAEGQSGYAGAVAVVLALVTFLGSLYFLRLGRRGGVI